MPRFAGTPETAGASFLAELAAAAGVCTAFAVRKPAGFRSPGARPPHADRGHSHAAGQGHDAVQPMDAAMSGASFRVLYVLGIHHSGTTLLGNLAGQLSGYLSVGELRTIWSKLALTDPRCGCGELRHHPAARRR